MLQVRETGSGCKTRKKYVAESFVCVCNRESKNIGKMIQNTKVLMDVNETTCFGIPGHNNVAKFYDTIYYLCAADVKISSGQK